MSFKDESELLFANDAFYAAFAGGDFAAMDNLWAQNAPVTCIHPGSPILLGRDDVMTSWQAILDANATLGIQGVENTAHIFENTGWVTCFERVEDAFLAATNIFVREDGRWKMTHHQATPTHVVMEADIDEPTPQAH